MLVFDLMPALCVPWLHAISKGMYPLHRDGNGFSELGRYSRSVEKPERMTNTLRELLQSRLQNSFLHISLLGRLV
jgi:hypothetical protein